MGWKLRNVTVAGGVQQVDTEQAGRERCVFYYYSLADRQGRQVVKT